MPGQTDAAGARYVPAADRGEPSEPEPPRDILCGPMPPDEVPPPVAARAAVARVAPGRRAAGDAG